MHANETSASGALRDYLNRLGAALTPLTDAERDEILLETRSHVAEQAGRSPMLSVPEILAELGEPDQYAQTFLSAGDSATPSKSTGALEGIARLATGSWMRLPILFLVLCCYSIAVFMVGMAVLEIFEPANTGLVVRWGAPGDRIFAFMASDPTLSSKGRDVLGGWLIPIGFSVAALIHVAMAALLRRFVPREAATRHGSGSRRARRGRTMDDHADL